MRTRLAYRLLAIGLGAGATAGMIAIPAAAGPPTNGCPNGYSAVAVAFLASQGYQVPGQVDDPTSGINSFGRPGNGDGYVCAQEIGNRTTPWGGQLYQFWDNTLP
jgi:hypothetical protein